MYQANKSIMWLIVAWVAATSLSAQERPAQLSLDSAETSGLDRASVVWLQPGENDFLPARLIDVSIAVPASRHSENQGVQFAWRLEDVSADTGVDSVARVESRQYWLDSKGSALASGISLPLTSRNAVIRISPLEGDESVQIDPADVVLSINGRRLDNDRALRSVADGDALNRQGMPVPPSTLAFRLGQEVGPGPLELSVQRLPPSQPMVIHVFEPESEWVGELSRNGHTVAAGDLLAFEFGLNRGDQQVKLDSVQAVLTDPLADQSWPLEIDPASGKLVQSAPTERFVSGFNGLYEAHVYVETRVDGLTVRRDLKLPVSVVPPLARFDGRSIASVDHSGLQLTLGVENAVPGRFQVNAQVFGTASDGSLQPLAFAQSAETLQAGAGSISLRVGADLVAGSGLSAPFEVRNLELLDQGRMYVLQRRHQALVIHR